MSSEGSVAVEKISLEEMKLRLEEQEKVLAEAHHNLAMALEEKALRALTEGRPTDNTVAFRSAWLYALRAAALKSSGGKASLSLALIGELCLTINQQLNSLRYATDTYDLGLNTSALAYRPDGKVLATGGDALRFWDANSGQALTQHAGKVNSLAYSPDSKLLATSGNGLRLWDAETGEPLKLLAEYPTKMRVLTFSPDSTVIAGASDSLIYLRNIISGEELGVLKHSEDVSYRYPEALAYSPDGKVLASATDKTVCLWNAETGELQQRVQFDDSGFGFDVSAMTFSPDNKALIVVGRSDTVFLEASSGQVLKKLEDVGDSNSIFSPDGKILVVPEWRRGISFWDINRSEKLKTITGVRENTPILLFSPDGKTLITDDLRFWDISGAEAVKISRDVGDKILATSPDGKIVVAGNRGEKTIRILDAATDKELKSLSVSQYGITSLAYRPDGKVLIVRSIRDAHSKEKALHFWDTQTWKELPIPEGLAPKTEMEAINKDSVGNLWVFSQDSNMLATTIIYHDNGVAQHFVIWDLVNGKQLPHSMGHGYEINITALAFSPDGNVIASGASETWLPPVPDNPVPHNKVGLWDTATGKSLGWLEGHIDSVTTLAYSPDGKVLASLSADSVRLWDTDSNKALRVLQPDDDAMVTLAYHPDGHILAVSERNRKIVFWNPNTGEKIKTLTDPQADTVALPLYFSSDGKVLISGGGTRRLWDSKRLWDFSVDEAIRVFKPDTEVISSHDGGVKRVVVNNNADELAYSPDGRKLAVATNRRLHIFDVASGEEEKSIDVSIAAMAYSPNGQTLAYGSDDDSSVHLWDTLSNEEVIIQQREDLTVSPSGSALGGALVYSLDGSLLASGKGTAVRLWDVDKSEERMLLKGHTDYITALAFSPDGKTLATASNDTSIHIFNTTTGKELKILKGHFEQVSSLAYSPDGQILASASWDNTIRLWNTESGKELKVLKGGRLHKVAYHPDGQILASASWGSDRGGDIRIWDTFSGETLMLLQGHTESINALTYSPDGKVLTSSSDDGTVRHWRLNPVAQKLICDFTPEDVEAALSFLWELELDGITVKDKPHPKALFPQLGRHITWTDETRKFRPLLDMPGSDETKMEQLVRWLEDRSVV